MADKPKKPDVSNLEDDDLWQAFAKDIKPLRKNPHKKIQQNQCPDTQVDDLETPQPDAMPETSDWPEDMAYFQAVVDGAMSVDDIPDKTPEVDADMPPPEPCQPRTAPASPKGLGFVIADNSAHKLAGWREGVDRKTRKNLVRGKFRPTLDVDLHGYYLMDAYAEIRAFLAHSSEEGHRCVLIIHGKGRSEGREMGVIKENLPRFLSEQPQVLAFHTAQTKDGGSGACYVLLKKTK